MLRRFIISFCIIFLFNFLCSCSDDEAEPECSDQLGELEANFSDDFRFNPRVTIFSPEQNGAISVSSFVFDSSCIPNLILSLDIEPTLGVQNFILTESFSNTPPNISFILFSFDVIIARWEIVEDEENWIEIDEISDTNLSGRFQATLRLIGGGDGIGEIPSIVRFDNVSFVASPSELYQDSSE